MSQRLSHLFTYILYNQLAIFHFILQYQDTPLVQEHVCIRHYLNKWQKNRDFTHIFCVSQLLVCFYHQVHRLTSSSCVVSFSLLFFVAVPIQTDTKYHWYFIKMCKKNRLTREKQKKIYWWCRSKCYNYPWELFKTEHASRNIISVWCGMTIPNETTQHADKSVWSCGFHSNRIYFIFCFSGR